MRLIFILLILLTFISAAKGQDISQISSVQRAHAEADSMRYKLGLDSLQFLQVKQIEQRYYDSLTLLSPQLSPDQRKIRFELFVAQRNESLQSVLTNTQWILHQQFLDEKRDRFLQQMNQRRALRYQLENQ